MHFSLKLADKVRHTAIRYLESWLAEVDDIVLVLVNMLGNAIEVAGAEKN